MNILKRFWNNLRELAHKEGLSDVFDAPSLAYDEENLYRITRSLYLATFLLGASMLLSGAPFIVAAVVAFPLAIYFNRISHNIMDWAAWREDPNPIVGPAKMIAGAIKFTAKGINLKDHFSDATSDAKEKAPSTSNTVKADQTLGL